MHKLAWEDLLRQWNGEAPPIVVQAAIFGRCVLALPRESQDKTFQMAEEMLIQQVDGTLSNAIATGFLEAIANRISRDSQQAKELIARMPIKCREYMHIYLSLE